MDTIGEIRMFAGAYAPAGWVFCDGQSLRISEYDAFFQLIGTTYGGNGYDEFKVPDLQSRIPIGTGQGAGLPNYTLGQTGGEEKNTLTADNLPDHTHIYTGIGIAVSSEDGHKTSPANNYPAVNGKQLYSTITDSQMAPINHNLTVGNTGLNSPQPITNIQPYLTISYIICCNGMYPNR
ncbi:MAG TPA: tail fiber protein [Niastella sp.]